MGKKMKIMMIVIGVIAAIFVSLIVLVNVLVTPERVRESLLPVVEKNLGRKVEAGRIEVSLFSGITVQELVVREKTGEGDFVYAGEIRLRYSFPALLMLRVEIDEITLVRPRIVIVRKPDGSFNFSDLTDSAASAASDGQTEKGVTAAPISLHISQVAIKDGELLYTDNSISDKSKQHRVTAIDLLASDVSPRSAFPAEMSADWNDNRLEIDGSIDPVAPGGEFRVRFNQVTFALQAGVQNEKIKATLELPQTSLQAILTSIPEAYVPDLGEHVPEGDLRLALTLQDDVLETSSFNVSVNEQVFDFKVKVTNLFGEPPRIMLGVKSPSVVVDRILPPAKPDGKKSPETVATKPEEVGPFDLPVELDADIRIGELVYNAIPVTDLKLVFDLRKNILSLKNLKAEIAGGTFTNEGKINLGVRGLEYTINSNLADIHAAKMIQLVKPELSDSFQGVLGGNIRLAGAGTVPETARKKLSGNGTLRLLDGRLQNIPALTSTAALLDIRDLREVVLDNGIVTFTVENGRVAMDSEITGSKTRLTTAGTIGLDGGLDLRSRLALSPELGGRLHEQGRLARYLGDEKGWTTVPLRIKGSYAEPDVGLDSKGLKKQAGEKVRQEVERKIEKELQKKLKGLFGN